MKKANCIRCGKYFDGTSELKHHAGNAFNLVARTVIGTIMKPGIGTIFALFGGTPNPYRPICDTCRAEYTSSEFEEDIYDYGEGY